jgi:hypothetical protein
MRGFDAGCRESPELEHGDDIVVHELHRNRTAFDAGKLLGAGRNVLLRLHNGNLIVTALGLNGNDIVTAARVDPDVEFVDFDLADPFGSGPEMILERIRCNAEEDVDETIVSDDGEKSLLVVECVRTDQFRRRVRHFDR